MNFGIVAKQSNYLLDFTQIIYLLLEIEKYVMHYL